MTMPARKPASYADLVALPEHVVGEIVEGKLVVSPRPGPRHAQAGSGAGADLFGGFNRKPGGPPDRPGGWWILFEPELHLHGGHVLVPDLAGWRRARMPALPETAWFAMPPDWVCEVVSPSSGRHDRIRKARIYRDCGVEWLWFIDPLQQTVEALHAETGRWVIVGGWEGEDAAARIPPFDALPLDLGRWWDTGAA